MRYLARPTVRYTGAFALIIAIPVVLDLAFSRAIDDVVHGGGDFPWWLLQFGSVGETVLAYSMLLGALSAIVVPLLTFYLGYRYGTRSSNPTNQ